MEIFFKIIWNTTFSVKRNARLLIAPFMHKMRALIVILSIYQNPKSVATVVFRKWSSIHQIIKRTGFRNPDVRGYKFEREYSSLEKILSWFHYMFIPIYYGRSWLGKLPTTAIFLLQSLFFNYLFFSSNREKFPTEYFSDMEMRITNSHNVW